MIARDSALGIGSLAAVALANVALWLAAHPSEQPWSRYAAELCGVGALVFFCCALVLVTLIPAIERAFAGLDRVVGIAVVLTGSLKREAERDRV